MFFTMVIMIKCKFDPTCLKFTNATNVPKVNYACLYYELQQPPKGSFSCIEHHPRDDVDFQWHPL